MSRAYPTHPTGCPCSGCYHSNVIEAGENIGRADERLKATKILTEILSVLDRGGDFQLGPKGRDRDLPARIRAYLEGK